MKQSLIYFPVRTPEEEASVPTSDKGTPAQPDMNEGKSTTMPAELKPTGRLRLVLQRLSLGFYDRPEVLRVTADKVTSELNREGETP